MAEPLSQSIRSGQGADCSPTLAALTSTVKDFLNPIYDEATKEVQIMETLQKRTFPQIENIFGNPIDAVKNASNSLIDDAFSGDFVDTAAQTLNSVIDPQRSRLFSIDKDCSSRKGTDTLSASFAGLSERAKDEITSAVMGAQKVASAFSALRSTDSGDLASFGTGLLHAGLNGLKTGLSSELFLLGQVTSTIKSLNRDISQLKDSDYSTDYLLLATICQYLLIDAHRNLGATLIEMRTGGRLNKDFVTIANQEVELARDLLGGTELSDIFGKLVSPLMVKIAAKITLLAAYTEALEQLMAKNSSRNDKIGDFLASYRNINPNVDFLYAPTLDLMRCKLRKIIFDIAAVAKLNQPITFAVKEKQWFVQLTIVLALFEGVKLLDKANPAIEKVVDAWQDRVKNVGKAYPGIKGASIPIELREYLRLVKQKVSFNSPTSVVTGRGEYIIDLINAYLKDGAAMTSRRMVQDTFGGVLPDGLAENIVLTEAANPLIGIIEDINTVAGPGIALAQTYLAFAKTESGGEASSALLDGDLSKFFSLDALTSNLGSQVQEFLNAAVRCYNEDDYAAKHVLTRNGTMFQEFERSDALFQYATGGYTREYVDVRTNTEISDIQSKQSALGSL